MDSVDTSWCPVCSRQILPKRYLVPVYPANTVTPTNATTPTPSAILPASTQAAAPAPPPSSPSSSSSDRSAKPASKARHNRTVARPRGGLARGTGRVRPNGSIKRADSKKDVAVVAAPAPAKVEKPAPQPAPIRHRTVIDQNPTPLYCSDECRLADLDSRQFYPLDYNPLRDVARDHCISPTLPPVPHNSLSNSLSCSSDETDSSEASSSPPDALDAPDYVSASYESMSPAIASLAKFYNFPPLPPRPSCIEAEAAEQPREEPKPRRTLEETYSSGIMMAAERIKEKMCTPRSIKPGRSSLSQPAVERKVVPGWTDGSSHWRADVYSLASPNDSVIRDLTKPDDCPRAYQSFTASPHRSIGGVYSTVSDATPTSPAPTRSTTADDVAYYPLTFVRRTDSRSSMHARSLPATTRPLVKKGAEGMLLVPNVELPVRSPSSYAGSESGSASGKSWRSGSKRNVARSPLGRSPSDMTASAEGTVRSSERKVAPAVRRPVVETRSWSYDNVRTYDVMPMPTPTKKETRYETRIVDGKEVRVETVVEVPCERQRLFLFPGKEVIRA